ncbi:hypothetical protein ACFZDJ_45410 [Streptomyces sp. NPDC007896]|uniref:hypothetical protein n=1 Tax=Streptomyces sp. NPDC007896 TaxID=3364784 RepID=UPI0036E0A172
MDGDIPNHPARHTAAEAPAPGPFIASRLMDRRRVPLDRCTLQDEFVVHQAASIGGPGKPAFDSRL